MGLILRTKLSLSDYDRIYDYIASNNEAAAGKLLRTLDAKLSLLSKCLARVLRVQILARMSAVYRSGTT